MSERVIQQALKIFEEQEKRGEPPSLAVLGPPGSGKSLFLGRLLSTIRNDVNCATKPCLMINLKEIRVGSQGDTYVYLNQELLKEATTAGISVDFDIRTQPSHLRFEEILRNLLAAVEGYLIIFIDHLESVPRVFASDLSQRFRNFLESTELDSEYRRLGLVIAGVVSLFELKHGPDSAFQMLRVIQFPQLDADTRKEMVEDYLKNFMSAEMPAELINFLAEMTGGEPGFLEPLIMNARRNNRQVALNEQLLLESAQEICSHSQVPALRNLALHLFGDKGLRDIVAELKNSRTVMQRSIVPDVDRYQLSGAVVVGRGPYNQSREYQFRNKITEMFLGQLYDLLESTECGPKPSVPIWIELQKMEAAKTECLNARQIWKWMKAVQDAWTLITPYTTPNLKLYVTNNNSEAGWWFDADLRDISGPEPLRLTETSTAKATHAALENTSVALSLDAETFRAFVESDADHISISIPLHSGALRMIISATLSKTDAGRGITEFEVWHWLRFVQNVTQIVPTLAFAELGRKLLCDPPDDDGPPDDVIRKVSRKHIYLLPQGGAVVRQPTVVSHIQGGFEPRDLENLNGRCLKLMEQWTDLREFEKEVGAIADQLETAITARFHSLSVSLAPAAMPSQVVIASDAEGLKLPFELFPYSGSHLALMTGVSRQIMGRSLHSEACSSFDDLFNSLMKQKHPELRVLLVASFINEAMEKESEELRKVRDHIEAGCRRMNLPTRVVEIGPEKATVKAVEAELIENGPYHLVHYSGHGYHFKEGPDLSGIVLRAENGKDVQVVTCRQLKGWFTTSKSWLVYLSCCNSSASSGRLGLSERYLGMMDAVALAGVPNIVGFRCMVSDQAALHLADEFYRQLFEVQVEKNLSQAMLSARRAVERRNDFFDAWATSMLITQHS
jgi:hypothetical protein